MPGIVDQANIDQVLIVDVDGNPTQGLSDAQDSSLQAILAELQEVPASVPHTALDATKDTTNAVNSSSASGETTVVSATAAQTTKVYFIMVSAAGATTVEIRNGAAGAVLKTFEFPAAGAYVIDTGLMSGRPLFVTSANTALVRNSTNAVKVVVDIEYVKS